MKYTFIIFLSLSIKFSFAQTDNKKLLLINSNYKMEYPDTWQPDTSKRMGIELIILSPLENDADRFRENVNVTVQDLSGQDIDLEKYKAITDKQLTEMVTDPEIFESTVITTTEKEYYKIDYAMTQGQFRLRIISVCYIILNKAYLVTFTSEAEKFEQYKKAGEEILGSLNINKKMH